MRAAEDLLEDLLDVAKLDSGVLRPDATRSRSPTCWPISQRQYAPLAAAAPADACSVVNSSRHASTATA